jgi:hypothetical protein
MKHPITPPDIFRDPPQEPPLTPPVTISFLWGRTSKVKEVWEVLQAVTAWPGVTVSSNSDGVCFALNNVTLGHLRWDARLELPFGPEVGERLLTEAMADPDPDHPESGRIVFDVRTPHDVDHAVWLLRLAYLSTESNLPVCGTRAARPAVRK